ncbi:uncharacterized protein LOC121874235 isoform X2 [Homarus americanus]|uniref:uncharacterized protein LOC121874235 isoform X2 n=1 Tax=Homarus americanus TaxID=6706 RepID=UPI001C471E58|nr:uncharacterized protein LOC121874235 isoform X2 [Homarus americanus]
MVLCHFLIILPSIRSDPNLSSSALVLVQAIFKHKPGLYWLIKNGIWEKMLLPCLRSPSMFVQREGVNVIATFMLLLIDTPHFESLVKDLFIISDKFCELRQQMSKADGEELRQSSLCVLRIFKEVYTQTLGKVAVYSQIRKVVDTSARLIAILNYKIPVTTVSCSTDLLILNILHKFQEQLMGYGILEQFLLDSLCGEFVTLTRLLLEKGYIESFLRSSVNIHKYWMIMVQNLKETKNIDLTSIEAVLHIVTNFQVTPILVLYQTSLEEFYKECPEKMKVIAKWDEEIHSRINIKDDIKVEASKLEKQILETLDRDPKEAVRMAIVCISAITGANEYLNPTCAVTVFQGMVFLLGAQDTASSSIRYNTALQRAVIDGLRVLVEKFNIDWRKCFASVCLMAKLCDLVNIPGISTQVKVCTLKAMNSCIIGFIPPVMSMLVNSEDLEHNSVETMGRALTIYLGDREWEVRDSALETLITCMKLAKEKYPHFVDWMLRYKLNLAVMTALGDVEGYVRASAFTVLANIISIDKVYAELKAESLPHRSLAFVLREGESPVRRAAVTLVQELFLAGKYSEEEVNGLVVRVIQHSAEDQDDEVRMASLEFIHSHILCALNNSGMVDGEFPSVIFSKGKIIKLDKEKVRSRVHSVLTWFCECGYLCSLLACMKDLVTNVATKALGILHFINELITRYDIHMESSVKNRRVSGNDNSNRGIREKMKAEKPIFVNVTRHDVNIPEDEIDKTISEILSSSSLESVTMIKRPFSESMDTSNLYSRSFLLTLDDVPSANPPLPLSCLLQSIDSLCQSKNTSQDDRHQINDILSLLDDILLDGDKQQSHADDQRLRDCY